MQNFKKGLLPSKHRIQLSQEHYSKTPSEIDYMKRVPYASAIGSLMYAILCTHPNICYAVGMVSRYQSNLGPGLWTVVKYILKYL